MMCDMGGAMHLNPRPSVTPRDEVKGKFSNYFTTHWAGVELLVNREPYPGVTKKIKTGVASSFRRTHKNHMIFNPQSHMVDAMLQ